MSAFMKTGSLLRSKMRLACAKITLQSCGAGLGLATCTQAHFCSAASDQSAFQGGVDAEERYRHRDSFDFIAASVRKCLTHLGPWSIGDLAFGVRALAENHKNLADHIEGAPVTDLKLLHSLHAEVKIADAIYEPTIERVTQLCSLRTEDVVTFVADGDRMRPAYCIARRPQEQQIVLVVRGTKSLGDAVTILTGSGADFQGGHTHAGMLHAAHWLLHNETGKLKKLLEENPGYKLHFIGHSLGAGAAALYAMLLRERAAAGRGDLPRDILPTCTAIATPACATADLATNCSEYVTSLICQNDIVPRACLWGFEQLRLEVSKTNWQDDFSEKFIVEGVRDFASNTSGLVGQQYKAVAELLTGKDARTAKVVGILGDAWDSLAENASKHSDGARQLLSKTSLRIARLPANSNLRQNTAAESVGSPAGDSDENRDVSKREVLEAPSRLDSLRDRLLSAYDNWLGDKAERRQSGGTEPGKSGRAETHQTGSPEPSRDGSAETGRPADKERSEQASSVQFSLAADDWWESSKVISGRHDIEPPSDKTLKGFSGSGQERRKALFDQMGKDVDKIAHSYRRRAANEEGEQSEDDGIVGVASDGDMDAELNQLLQDYSEADAAAKEKFSPPLRMYAPGKLIYLKRIAGEAEQGEYEALWGEEGQAVGRIILSRSMIMDHLCSTYMAALEDVISKLEQSGNSPHGAK